MKSNFNFIDELLKETKPNTRRTLRILQSVINELEGALHERVYSQNKLPFRYYSEVLTKFVYEVIYYSIEENDSYNEIMERWTSKFAHKKNKLFNMNDFTNVVFEMSLIDKVDSKAIKDFLSSINHDVHIINQSKPLKEIKAYLTNDVYSIEPITYEEYLGKLRKLHKTLLLILNILFKETNKMINDVDFIDEVYIDGRDSFNTSRKGIELSKLANNNEKCLLCNGGIITYPKSNKYSNGPFLQCNNKECAAIMSINLNLKSQNEIESCEHCVEENKGKGKIKQTISYDEESDYYKVLIEQCNSCKEIKQ